MSCEWNYEVKGVLPTESATVNIAGQSLDIAARTPRVEALLATGTVSFECPDSGGCRPKIHRLSYRRAPDLDLADLADHYEFPEAAQVVADQFGITITQPTVMGDAELTVVPTGDGSCINVQIRAELALTAGSAVWDPPDVPLPGGSQTITTPPVTAKWGAETSDVLSAEYLLCCCHWDEAVPLLERTDKKAQEDLESEPWGPYEPVETCGIGCHFESLSQPARRDESSPIRWTVTATEGPCDCTRTVITVPTGLEGMTEPAERTRRVENEKREVDRSP